MESRFIEFLDNNVAFLYNLDDYIEDLVYFYNNTGETTYTLEPTETVSGDYEYFDFDEEEINDLIDSMED